MNSCKNINITTSCFVFVLDRVVQARPTPISSVHTLIYLLKVGDSFVVSVVSCRYKVNARHTTQIKFNNQLTVSSVFVAYKFEALMPALRKKPPQRSTLFQRGLISTKLSQESDVFHSIRFRDTL